MPTSSLTLTNGSAEINKLTKLESGEPHLPAHLTQEEEQAFFRDESIVRNTLARIWEMGEALKRIRDQKYYRAEYATFEVYLAKRWNLGRAYCYRLIEGADMAKCLAANNVDEADLPANEWQMRPLLGLKPETAALAWKQALDRAAGQPMTAKLVEQAVSKLVPPEKKLRKDRRPKWNNIVADAKASLKHLATAEDAIKGGKNLEAGLKCLAKVRILLELWAKQ